MRKSKSLWICMIVTSMLASVGFAQDRNRDPGARQRGEDAGRGRKLYLRWKMERLLPQLGEHIGRHCALDEAAVDKFRATVFESVNTMLEQDTPRGWGLENLRADDFTLVETMLSQPGWREAFAKCLTEKQLQDYTDFTHTRRQLDQQAVRKQIAAWLDRPLSLTADQRGKVEQAISAATEGKPMAISSLSFADAGFRGDLMDSTLRLFPRFSHIQLNGILSPAQATVWALMRPKSKEQGNPARRVPREQEGRDNNRREPDVRLARYRKAEAELNRAVEAGRITREQANERLLGLRQQIWAADPTVRGGDDMFESEDQARRLAEAQLAAHTEQLGQLDAQAVKRLGLAAKGVVERILESQDRGQRAGAASVPNADVEGAAIRIRAAVAAGRITREQAAERLGAMRKRGSETRQQIAPVDITSHALYQQTIKDVLSKEAYAKYRARQTENLAFRQQAACDLLVASLDLQLWLGEKQRKRFEQAAAKLPAPAADATASAPAEMPAKLHDHFSRTEPTVLSPWQAEQFEAIRMGRNRRKRLDGQ